MAFERRRPAGDAFWETKTFKGAILETKTGKLNPPFS